ncbi:hypothetical protein F0562_012799 [Nyssa sinensis]|uniref:Chromo domain-containing protein n=1 Tax=Nyssa sinensis TaxID=561372 RepID=A0A5J4ZXW2_9ASTE|nr:hypothetical protein F0562_012799 [Nyssa sinensis]
MKERLKEKHLPIDYEQMMFEDMLQLRQGSLSVDQFMDRFHELTIRNKIVETEQQTLARYRTKLRSELCKEMWTARLINVEEAYQLALYIEKQMGPSVGRKMIYMRDVHDECKWRLTSHTNSYAASANAKRKDRQFNKGDMVLVRFRLERFPPGSFTKLHARRAGPFRVTKKLRTNAYVIDLPFDFGISLIFNIEDLTKFKGDVNEFFAIPVLEVTPALRVLENIAPQDEIAAILDHQFVTTRREGYYKFLVQWKNRPNSNSVWLQASEVKRLHPHLFAAYTRQNLPESSSSGEPAIDANQEKDTP